MSATASSLALSILMEALVQASARMEASQRAAEFENGLTAMRAEYEFFVIDQPEMVGAEGVQ